jgi:predicted HicB family RNase H-like nuclease
MGLHTRKKQIKTENFIFRIAPQTKKALFTLSKKEGVSASELIRRMINDKAENNHQKK